MTSSTSRYIPRDASEINLAPSAAATSPLTLVGFDGDGEPVFNFTGPDETFVDDPSVLSRWQVQLYV